MIMTGLGIDIVDLTREEFNTPNFATRYMTKYEYEVYMKCNSEHEQKNYMACIWSLKEAIIKATNHEVIFSDIEIKLTSEAPVCNITTHKIFLSFSFEKKIATGIAIAYKNI